jgi:hypothetical protein
LKKNEKHKPYLAIEPHHVDGTILVPQFMQHCLYACSTNHSFALRAEIGVKSPTIAFNKRYIQGWVERERLTTHIFFDAHFETNVNIATDRVYQTPFTAIRFQSDDIKTADKSWTFAVIISVVQKGWSVEAIHTDKNSTRNVPAPIAVYLFSDPNRSSEKHTASGSNISYHELCHAMVPICSIRASRR